MGTNNQAIRITDLRKIAQGESAGTATTIIQPLAVKSAKQIIFENTKKKLQEEKESFMAMSDEDQCAEIRKNMPLGEMVKSWRDSLRMTYPGTMAVTIAAKPNGDDSIMIMEHYGDIKKLGAVLGTLMDSSKDAIDLVNQAIVGFSKHCSPEEAEQCITALQDIIKNFRQQQEPRVIIARLQQEIKRLTKSCRFDLVAIKKKELQEFQERLASAERRKAANLKNLEKAREAKIEIKRRKQQLEKEHNRQQPNFSKMAKKKMQKIKERQAAKRQKSGAEENSVKSCSMFNNVG